MGEFLRSGWGSGESDTKKKDKYNLKGKQYSEELVPNLKKNNLKQIVLKGYLTIIIKF